MDRIPSFDHVGPEDGRYLDLVIRCMSRALAELRASGAEKVEYEMWCGATMLAASDRAQLVGWTVRLDARMDLLGCRPRAAGEGSVVVEGGSG
jgi:hypothetical protein